MSQGTADLKDGGVADTADCVVVKSSDSSFGDTDDIAGKEIGGGIGRIAGGLDG